MKTTFIIIITLLIIGFWFVRVFHSEEWEQKNNNIGTTIKINDATLNIEIADSPVEQQKGLSGRVNLPHDTGLLFIMSQISQPAFWMKEMNFPIDIIWIDEDWIITEISPNLAPETYPQTFTPKKPIRYVLEVNAGWVSQNKIRTGDKIILVKE